MRKNVAGQKIGAQLVSASDGSAFTGSVTVSVTVDAGTQATGSVGSGACTHEGGGYHTYAPSQAETNGDLIAFTFSGTGAVPVTVQIYTRPTTGLLAPTVADRTLDVSAGGEAGIDWANVGSPTTLLNLSGTTISTSQAVASVSGAVNSVTSRVTANTDQLAGQTITAASGVTFPSSVASPTNITSASGIQLAANQDVRNVTGTISDKNGYALTSAERTSIAAVIEAEILNDATGGAVITTIANAVAAYFDNASTDIPPAIIATAVRNALATELARIDQNISTPVVLATSQPNYAPAKQGDAMTLTSAERSTLAGVVWGTLTSGLTTVGSIGKHLIDRIVGTLATGTHTAQSGDSFARLGAPANGSIAADIAAVDGGGGAGGGTVVVMPLQLEQRERVPGNNVKLKTRETPMALFDVLPDENGEIPNLNLLTLEVVIETLSKSQKITVPAGSITKDVTIVGGKVTAASIMFRWPSGVTAATSEWEWSLRETANSSHLSGGLVTVVYAP